MLPEHKEDHFQDNVNDFRKKKKAQKYVERVLFLYLT